MSVEFYRESPGKFDSRTLNRTTLSRWTGRNARAGEAFALGEAPLWTRTYGVVWIYIYIYIYTHIIHYYIISYNMI